MKPIHLDGRTGEGGGQLVRMAIGLAALTCQPIRITNIRGRRPGGKGLKHQHVAAIQWLADATDAGVEGLEVGSQTLTFEPARGPASMKDRVVEIQAASSAGSALLILQAVLPFLLFAADEGNEPIRLAVCGGTNASGSLSFEYLDQVLLPALEDRFGIRVDRHLAARSWSLGPLSRGRIETVIHPVPLGRQLEPRNKTYADPEAYKVRRVDVTIITPDRSHTVLREELSGHLSRIFPGADLSFKTCEDSQSLSRWYILLVAHAEPGLRWGRDALMSLPKKVKDTDLFSRDLASHVCGQLQDEVSVGGQVDEFLQDQLVCFQALSSGSSSIPRGVCGSTTRSEADGPFGHGVRHSQTHKWVARVLDSGSSVQGAGDSRADGHDGTADGVDGPFGHGSRHSQTARWVASRILRRVEFLDNGDVVKGIGFSVDGG